MTLSEQVSAGHRLDLLTLEVSTEGLGTALGSAQGWYLTMLSHSSFSANH